MAEASAKAKVEREAKMQRAQALKREKELAATKAKADRAAAAKLRLEERAAQALADKERRERERKEKIAAMANAPPRIVKPLRRSQKKVVRPPLPEHLKGRARHSKPTTVPVPFALGADRENVDPTSPGTPVPRRTLPYPISPVVINEGPTPGRAIPHSPDARVVAHARNVEVFLTTLERRLAGNDAILSSILAK